MSTRPRIKSLQEQVNNSTLVKPKEIDKFLEDKSCDKNQNKDCELFIKQEKAYEVSLWRTEIVFQCYKKRT